MTSATWTCPRCGTVHSIYSMTCNCPAPSVATDTTDYVLDLRPMKSERMVLVSAYRIAALEAQISAMRPVVDAAIAFVHQPGSAHYIPASLSPVCKLEEAVRKYEEVKA